jgi:hypothetical protein
MEYTFLCYSDYKCVHHEDERKRVRWTLKFTCDYSSICGCILLGCSFGTTNKELKKVENFGRKLLNTLSSGHNALTSSKRSCCNVQGPAEKPDELATQL